MRDAILHLFSAEEGAEGTRTSLAEQQLRGNMVPSPPLAKESQEECVNCKALAEQLAAAREKNKNLEAELAGLRRPAKRTIDQVVASSSADCDVGDDEHMPGQPAEKEVPKRWSAQRCGVSSVSAENAHLCRMRFKLGNQGPGGVRF